jgi:hypothetical protein
VVEHLLAKLGWERHAPKGHSRNHYVVRRPVAGLGPLCNFFTLAIWRFDRCPHYTQRRPTNYCRRCKASLDASGM